MRGQEIFNVKQNYKLADAVYRMELEGNASSVTAAGQFVNVKTSGCYLRRPFSVCDFSENSLTIVYKTAGKGTEAFSRVKPGEKLDVLVGLGNGYSLDKSGERPLLIGGGVGIPPLYGLAKRLAAQGREVNVVLGFNTASEIFLEKDFRALGVGVTVTTVDGSYGKKGLVTDVLGSFSYTHHYTCGPRVMLKAVYEKTTGGGSYSLEERMACGFGACLACTCKTTYGHARVCKEGPVFEKEDLVW